MARIALVLAALLIPLLPLPAQAVVAAPADDTTPADDKTPADDTTPADSTSPVDGTTPMGDTRELTRTRFTLDGKALPKLRPRPARRPAGTAVTPPVGTVRQWLGLDERSGGFYRKDYTLRGVGAHIEVWVADDIAFPAGDCRATRVQVTGAQVSGLIREFDGNIYPKETAAFSTPPDRDGRGSALNGDFSGAGDRTVTLVDNVRDDNYYRFPAAETYLAGFFSAQLNELFDRNVMTIDAYDWQHRTGAGPPDEPTGDLCTSRPGRPRMYEATFAHEWQHLLEYYADPQESAWVNEGLSDYAQTLVGYVDSTKTVYQRGFDAHLTCFQGFGAVATAYNTNPRDCGGPQNSLNLWDEGAPNDILADYGNAYQFMLYLHDRFGATVLARLHRDRARRGLAGVAAALPAGRSLYGVLHDYQTTTLTDRTRGGMPSLRSTVNLSPAAYDRPGAAPNGADYVRLRDHHGRYLTGHDLHSVRFDGAPALPPQQLQWTTAGGALFSGDASNLDVTAITEATVPASDPTLRFLAKYGAERGYDFGYVMVSANGGKAYAAVAGDKTVMGPLGPAINGTTIPRAGVRHSGTTGEFVAHRYDLSAYAGKKVLIGFRYVSDGSLNLGGWSVKGITLGATAIRSTVDRFRSPTQIVPIPVQAWSVRLVGMSAGRAREVPVRQWARLKDFDRIVAIVAYDEPTETITQYAPYSLTVNGAVQPGGAPRPVAPARPAGTS